MKDKTKERRLKSKYSIMDVAVSIINYYNLNGERITNSLLQKKLKKIDDKYNCFNEDFHDLYGSIFVFNEFKGNGPNHIKAISSYFDYDEKGKWVLKKYEDNPFKDSIEKLLV